MPDVCTCMHPLEIDVREEAIFGGRRLTECRCASSTGRHKGAGRRGARRANRSSQTPQGEPLDEAVGDGAGGLGELIQMFKSKGWSVVDVRNAYENSVFRLAPDVLPAGQSLLWSMAKATGRFDGILRYPGEDGTYEASKMDALSL
jgi:hypothetical protein